jgi:hypothetical protein
MEMGLVSEMELLKEQIWVSQQVGQHYRTGMMLYQKQTHQVQSVRGLVGSMTSQSMDYIGQASCVQALLSKTDPE